MELLGRLGHHGNPTASCRMAPVRCRQPLSGRLQVNSMRAVMPRSIIAAASAKRQAFGQFHHSLRRDCPSLRIASRRQSGISDAVTDSDSRNALTKRLNHSRPFDTGNAGIRGQRVQPLPMIDIHEIDADERVPDQNFSGTRNRALASEQALRDFRGCGCEWPGSLLLLRISVALEDAS